MNFSYGINGRHVRDSITAQLSKPDFRFVGVSVSEPNADYIICGYVYHQSVLSGRSEV